MSQVERIRRDVALWSSEACVIASDYIERVGTILPDIEEQLFRQQEAHIEEEKRIGGDAAKVSFRFIAPQTGRCFHPGSADQTTRSYQFSLFGLIFGGAVKTTKQG